MTVRARYLDPKTATRVDRAARDLSLGGVFIETDAPLDEGSLVTIEIQATAATVTVDARVATIRSRPDGEKPAGMGVRFLELAPDVAAALMRVLRASNPREKTLVGVGAPAPGSKAPPETAEERRTLGIGIRPEDLDAPKEKVELPERFSVPQSPFDKGWDRSTSTGISPSSADETVKTSEVAPNEISLTSEAVSPPKPQVKTIPPAARSAEHESPHSSRKRRGFGLIYGIVVIGGLVFALWYLRNDLANLVHPPPAPLPLPPLAQPDAAPPAVEAGIVDAEAAGTEAPPDAAAEVPTSDAGSKDAGNKDAGGKDAGAKDAAPEAGAKKDAGVPPKRDGGAAHKKQPAHPPATAAPPPPPTAELDP